MRVGSRRARLSLLAAYVGALALALSACDGGRSTPHGPVAVPDARQVLRLPVVNPAGSDLATMDPALAQDDYPQGVYAIAPIALVFPGLVELDASLNVVDYAAAGVDISPDGKNYTFHVRRGLTWSDGTPIDAQTFAYAIDRALHPCLASPVAYYLYNIRDAQPFHDETCADPQAFTAGGPIKSLIGDSITATDPQTLVVALDHPAAYFLAALSYPTAYAVPRQLIERYGETDWTAHLPDHGGLGGALYTLARWDHTGRLVLRRNGHFWGKKPRLREIDITVYTDRDAEYRDYLAQKLDVGVPPPSQYATARKQAGFHETGYLETDYFAMNWHDAPFDDVGMRQAFDLVLDKTALARSVFHGAADPTNNIVPKGMPGYNPSLQGPQAAGPAGNPALAAQLEQRYVQAHCGGDATKCPAVTLSVPLDSPDLGALAQAALAMWQQTFPGYPISVQPVEFSALVSDLAAKHVQFWAIYWIADYPDPQDWLSLQFLPGAPYNNGNVGDAQANQLMAGADADQNQAERIQRYQQAEQLLVGDVAWLPLDQPKDYYRVQRPVLAYSQGPQGYPSAVDQWPRVFIAE